MDTKLDNELIDLALSGHRQAFAALADRYYTTVYRYAFRWLQVREDAEDVAQEVFIKLANSLHTFNRQSAFSTWLYRITANCAKDFLRKHSMWNKNKTTDFPDERLVSPNPGPETKSFHEQIVAAIHILPEKLKEATLLVFAEEMTHKEAARILGCAETTVSWRIFQAKKTLKKVLS
jgi:RNA polymerase sigma-70 factor (ECF subfamily)